MKHCQLVSVIIVNFNQNKHLSCCLESLMKQTFNDIEIIVIDNASKDGSIEILKSKYPSVKLVINQENKLFSYAHNQGIKEARGDFVLSLNNDVILESNYIDELVRIMENNRNIGMTTGKILSFDKKIIDSAGQFISRERTAKERGFKENNNGQFEEPRYVFGVPGVACLYRKEMLEMIKIDNEWFDSTYGLFYEDLDLNWRANRFGWKAYYNPKTIAYHVRGATAKSKTPPLKFLRNYYFPQLSEELQFHFIKNRYMTMIKNDNLKDFLMNFWNIVFYDLKLWSYVLLFRPKIILRLPQILKYLKIALEKRKNIKLKLMISKEPNINNG